MVWGEGNILAYSTQNHNNNIPKEENNSYVQCINSFQLLNIFQKMQRRKAALKQIGWDPDKKKVVEDVLVREYISSDEEGTILFETTTHRVRYQRKLQWESADFTKAKQELDEFYRTHVATANQRDRMMVIKLGERLSERGVPNSAPDWILHPDHKN